MKKRPTSEIAELGDWRGETLSRIRKLIKKADPDVVEGKAVLLSASALSALAISWRYLQRAIANTRQYRQSGNEHEHR